MRRRSDRQRTRRAERAKIDTLGRVTELTERAVVARVPSLVDERLQVLGRREPVTVPPGTSLADCLAEIQRDGTGDSVFVVDATVGSPAS